MSHAPGKKPPKSQNAPAGIQVIGRHEELADHLVQVAAPQPRHDRLHTLSVTKIVIRVY